MSQDFRRLSLNPPGFAPRFPFTVHSSLFLLFYRDAKVNETDLPSAGRRANMRKPIAMKRIAPELVVVCLVISCEPMRDPSYAPEEQHIEGWTVAVDPQHIRSWVEKH